MKRLLSLTMIGAMLALAIAACKDDFNEQDFMRQQLEVKKAMADTAGDAAIKEYINAVNEAGDLLALTLMVRENGIPVPGVTVALTTSTPNAISSGRAKAVQTGTTDAAGIVVFDKVTIGSGTVTFKKTGYVGSTANVDFQTPGAPITVQVTNPVTGGTMNKFLPPAKRFEEAIIPMYSATSGAGASTATISGKVSIENNVTNLTPEVPAGLVIRANLVGLIAAPNATFITNFAFEDASTLGVATVAANGTYTMTVPATAAGLTINLIVPNIDGVSRMAVNAYDNGAGVAVLLPGGPEYRDVPTSWGPQPAGGFGTIVPTVTGAKVVFPTPPAAGSGLTFDFTAVARSLVIGAATVAGTLVQEQGQTFFRINSRGNYTNGPAPTVEFSGGGGTGATCDVNMRTYVTSLTVLNQGQNYGASVPVPVTITRVRNDDVPVPESTINITSLADGRLPATIDLAPFASQAGFAANNPKTMTVANLKLLKITVGGNGTQGDISGNFKTEVSSVNFTNGGLGYTTAPTLVFKGGGLADGSADHASLDVVELPVQWNLAPNNSNTVDYALVPSFLITYPNSPTGFQANDTDVETWLPSGMPDFQSSLAARLITSSGDIVKKEPVKTLRTLKKSGGMPTIQVTPIVPVQASWMLNTTNINSVTGAVSLPTGVQVQGSGYTTALTATLQPSASGAPGTGASISVGNTFNAVSREYRWDFTGNVTNAGSGYLQNLNQKGTETAVFPSPINAQPGKSYTADIIYGTGTRRANVN